MTPTSLRLLLPLILLLAALPGELLAAEDLRLVRVMLSSGGVGYFEYAAEVEGDQDLSLTVPLEQVDDVLKSIVVYDDRGGIGQARLPSREPLAQVFRNLPFGPEALDAPDILLNALQGAEIRAEGARALTGRVLKVARETVVLPDGGGMVDRNRVTLVTGQGLRQFVLEEAESVAFTDPELAAQVEGALAALTTHRVRDSRAITIRSRGQGKRQVRVGYVVAAPLWKTSYRVSLPAAGAEGSGRLQGWAHVDNLSGRDWDGVELTLVSGNPVTFRQALYRAYFVDRPEVPVEVLGRVLPRLDQGALALGDIAEPEQEFRRRTQSKEELDVVGGLRSFAEAAPAQPRVAGEPVAAQPTPSRSEVFLAAAAEEAATQVVFRVPEPVSAGKGESLMVPIVDRDLPAARLALYQPGTHATRPLASLRLENDGESGLPPGILTLYERGAAGASYLGDARLATLPAGETRLVSFALDQKVKIDREPGQSARIAKGRIARGLLELTYEDERRTVYRIAAPAREARTVILEHPRLAGWELVEPSPDAAETTETHYRISRELNAGEQAEVEVVLRRPRLQSVQLASLSRGQMIVYAETGELDEKLRRAIAGLAEIKARIEDHEQRLAQLAEARRRIFEEQKRIRDNLARIPSNSDLYRRYLAKLDAQEDELEGLKEDTEAAQAKLDEARQDLVNRIAAIDLE